MIRIILTEGNWTEIKRIIELYKRKLDSQARHNPGGKKTSNYKSPIWISEERIPLSSDDKHVDVIVSEEGDRVEGCCYLIKRKDGSGQTVKCGRGKRSSKFINEKCYCLQHFERVLAKARREPDRRGRSRRIINSPEN
jgi:hypothetical protein